MGRLAGSSFKAHYKLSPSILWTPSFLLSRVLLGGNDSTTEFSFKGTLRDIGLKVAKASVWRRIIDASRLSLLCEASLAVHGPWMATACRAGMKEPAEKTSCSCAEPLEFAP